MKQKRFKVALAVNTFLGYTNSWIYRQITGKESRAELALCHNRYCETDFPFDPVVVSPNHTPRILRKIRGKLWTVFKYFPTGLSLRQHRDFKQAILSHEINLVHAHFATTGAKYASLCRELNIPLIITAHGFDITSAPRRWPAYKKMLQKLWHQCPFFIVISKEMGNRLARLGCPENRIRVSYLGVPVEEFQFVDRTGRHGPIRFLHAGRLTEKKGVPDLVRSFALAFPEPGAAILDIVGDGEEKDLIERAINETKPANSVNILGRLSVQELAVARFKADVFVLNCRVDNQGTKEGLPISTLEAASTGLPAISTFHAGIPESIIDEKTGILVPEKDNDALSNAMKKMLNNETRLTMGVEARKLMEEKFDVKNCNKVLGEFYKEAVEIYNNA